MIDLNDLIEKLEATSKVMENMAGEMMGCIDFPEIHVKGRELLVASIQILTWVDGIKEIVKKNNKSKKKKKSLIIEWNG